MVKEILKKTFGDEQLSKIKGIVYHYCCTIVLFFSGLKKIDYAKNALELQFVFTESNYHVFRGYYDIDYVNQDGTRFLCHRLPESAKNNRQTKCEVGYYNLITGVFEKIADTSAWSWQQGSRLRWIDRNHLIFNDVSENSYCARIFNVETKQQSGVIKCPLYDFTPDFRYGFTLNFARLQRLRPGYGYDFYPDETEGINAPSNDGIIRIDLASGETELLYSLNDLAQYIDDGAEYIHYVNHISVAPDGEHFIFFHIYTNAGDKDWKTILYVSDIQGHELVPLEKRDRASHYCWVDNSHIMVTCHKDNGQEYYAIYDIDSGNKKILQIPELCVDGHPSKYIDEKAFITDTYPLKNSLQKIRIFHIDDDHAETIASIYHDYRLRGEKRCDLHPSVSSKSKLLSIDSTFQKKRRSVIVFNLISENKNA